ncbi:MAG: putative DNA modification/repair radical SAM protein [Myxococcales bacterium]
MDLRQKLAILADAAKYDASCASGGARGAARRSPEATGICHSYTPDGRCVSLLRILLTNHCVFDCLYCINRRSSDTPRARFTVEEVVRLTLDFYDRNYVEGLFLSSGIALSPDATMEQLVRVARTLREAHGFRGYIHLKAVAGCSPLLLADAGRFADRLSANVELPTEADLSRFAPEKRAADIDAAMSEIHRRKEETRDAPAALRYAPAGQTTQLIVGASPTPDRDILATASALYDRHRLTRIYYSAFSPIPHADARLPLRSPPLVREHRLYQADWLMRFYGFAAAELTSPAAPDLPLDVDPKLAWALRHRAQFPVDLQRAPRELLLRVPGLGVRMVERLLRLRRHQRVRLADLAALRAPLRRLAPFVVTADHNPALRTLDQLDLERRVRAPTQLSLFDARASARSGEL